MRRFTFSSLRIHSTTRMSTSARPTALQAFAQNYGNASSPGPTNAVAGKTASPTKVLSPLAVFAAQQQAEFSSPMNNNNKSISRTQIDTEDAPEGVGGIEDHGSKLKASALVPATPDRIAQPSTQFGTVRASAEHQHVVIVSGLVQGENGATVHADDESEAEDLGYFDFSSSDKLATKETESSQENAQLPHPNTDEADDLYDLENKGVEGGVQSFHIEHSNIFIPKGNGIELFHCALTQDDRRLSELLASLSPREVLDIRDHDNRSLYHYAVLSRSQKIQEVVFGHIDSHHEALMKSQFQIVMQEKGNIDRWLSESKARNNRWMPPGALEVHRKSVQRKERDWKMVCEAADKDGRSLLHYAGSMPGKPIFAHNMQFIHVIRSHPAILHSRDSGGWMPLHFATKRGNLDQIKWYFELGIRIDQDDATCLISLNRAQLIHDALLQRLEKIDRKIYHSKAESKEDKNGFGNWNIGIGVFARAKMERAQGHTTFLSAVKYGNMSAVVLLLQQGADPKVACDLNGWNALHVCASEGTQHHVEIVRLLLNPPFSLSANAKSLKRKTPLHVAAKSRQHHDCSVIIAELISHGAKVDARDHSENTPLHLASQAGNATAMKCLLRAGCGVAAVNCNGCNALHLAACRGNADAIAVLIAWEEGVGYLSDIADHHGRKPADVACNEATRLLLSTWRACYRGECDTIKRLVQSKKHGNRDQQDKALVALQAPQSQRTPLHVAIQGYSDALHPSQRNVKTPTCRRTKERGVPEPSRLRYRQSMSILIQAGADTTAADRWGITPIMLAATVDDEALMEMLLDLHTDVLDLLQHMDDDGNSALHYSYAFCQAGISSLLEESMDYDTDLPNGSGKTPFEVTGLRFRMFPEGYRAQMKLVDRYFKQAVPLRLSSTI